MKLWLLRPVGVQARPDGRCEPPPSWCPPSRLHLRGVVIQAETEVQARATVQRIAVDAWSRESWIHPYEPGGPAEIPTWLDASRTTCVELVPGRHAHVVMADWSDG